jgi:arylsulfatase A-like enzyme
LSVPARPPPRAAPARVLCAALLLAATGCGRAAVPNVVLVSVDTLRADAIGPYGGVPTPTLDRLAAEGVLFEQAFAPAPATAPSHATLFTGQDVLRHGVLRNGDALPESADTLAERLRARGFHTAAFASSFVLDPRFGWGQGFEDYDAAFSAASASLKRDPYPGAFWAAHRFDGFDRRAVATDQAVRAWLASAREPFFLFVHFFDPHAPYVPPKDYSGRLAGRPFLRDDRAVPGVAPKQLERLIRLYHGEVLYVDDSIGVLLEAVASRRSSRPTLTLVTADHGEALGQHGWIEHGRDLYDEQIRVPLLMHWPGRIPAGHRVRTPVTLADVPATIVELVGGGPPAPGSDGRSLAAAAQGGPDPELRALLAHHHPVAGAAGGVKTALRVGGWKYLRSSTGREELYELTSDPAERQSLAATRPDVTRTLAALTDERLAKLPDAAPAAPLPDETLRALRALGYVE